VLLGPGDRCGSVRSNRRDTELTDRLIPASARSQIGDRPESEEVAKQLEQRSIARRDGDFEGEAETRCAVFEGRLVPGDDEGAFAGDEAGQHERCI
jgi:hypothetical protein